MIESLIDLGRGSLFRFAVAVAVLGLLRHLMLSVLGLSLVWRRAGDKRLDISSSLARTADRLNPLRYFIGSRWLYSILSMSFHLGIFLVPVFSMGHIRLWERGTGLSWPSLSDGVAEVLTLLTAATAVLLLIGRGWSPTSRTMSRPQDWLLPPLIAVEFLTGYALARPGMNPFSLTTTMFLHVWIGDLLLILTPFTKIAHCALLPLSGLAADMAWRMTPSAGREMAKTLGKEGQPI